MNAYLTIAAIVGLSVVGAISGVCLVLLVAERQTKRREREGTK